eukprot:15481136-Alexandrium_andersonii.AAC.1
MDLLGRCRGDDNRTAFAWKYSSQKIGAHTMELMALVCGGALSLESFFEEASVPSCFLDPSLRPTSLFAWNHHTLPSGSILLQISPEDLASSKPSMPPM